MRLTDTRKRDSCEFRERFVLMTAVVERRLGPFQDVQRELCDVELSDASAADGKPQISQLAVDDLISIADNGQVCVVRDHDGLTPPGGLVYRGNKLRCNGLVVEVLLRLIEKQWRGTTVNYEVKQREDEPALARSQLG